MSSPTTQSESSFNTINNADIITDCEGEVTSISSTSSQSEASFNPMEDFEGISYSQEETVRAFRDYYTFLTKMYVGESRIAEPPPGGWPSITKERYRGMGKNDTVIELLRHLPYLLQAESDFRPIEVVSYCHFFDFERGYRRSEDEGDSAKTLTESHLQYEDFIPAHVVGFCSGESDPHVMLLET